MAKKWLLALVLAATPAMAHDWYPHECCHGMDCAPAQKVELLSTQSIAAFDATPVPPGTLLVTTRHGSVVVPGDFPRRESKDSRMHACMRPGPGGQMRLICVFMPPAM
jgi:hypothetical protein